MNLIFETCSPSLRCGTGFTYRYEKRCGDCLLFYPDIWSWRTNEMDKTITPTPILLYATKIGSV